MTYNSGRALSIHFHRSPGSFSSVTTSLSFCVFLRFGADVASVEVPVALRFEPVLAAEPDATGFYMKDGQQESASA